MGFFDDVGGFVSGVAQVATSGPLGDIINSTPIAPFAGAINAAAKGDWRGLAASGAKLGASTLLEEAGISDIPVVGQLATSFANSQIDSALGVHASAQVQRGRAAPSGLLGGLARVVNQTSSMVGGGVAAAASSQRSPASSSQMDRISRMTPAPGPAAYSPPPPAPPVNSTSQVDAYGSPTAVTRMPSAAAASPAPYTTAPYSSASTGTGIQRPYGKVFATRSAWEAFASRPETAGGTIGFP